MQLETKHFGTIDIEESGIVHFPEGLPGFESVKKFVILGIADESHYFQWLQSVDFPELAFVVMDPKRIIPEYEIEVEDSEVELLEIKDIQNILVFVILVIPDDITKMRANLKCPIIINAYNKLGKQIIAQNEEYSIRHLVYEKLKNIEGQNYACTD